MMRRAALLLVLPIVPVGPAHAAGGAPAGIVMSAAGPMMPRYAAYSEILADTGVQLGKGATLTFLHYERCKLVTVSTGTLMLTPTDYASDGKIVSEAATPCPVVQAVNAKAGPVSAAAAPGVRLPFKPDIVFTGNGGARLTAASIAEDGRVSPAELRLDVAGRRAHLPTGAALRAGARYRLRVSLGGRAEPIELAFVAGGEGSLVVLRIE